MTSKPTTKSTKKAQRTTWFDFIPPEIKAPPVEHLLTREELLEELNRQGAAITEDTLISWEKRGVLPRARRSRLAGRPVALYPEWAVSAIRQVRTYQAQGLPLAEIGPKIHHHAHWWALSQIRWADPLAPARKELRTALEAWALALDINLDLDRQGGGREIAGARVVLVDQDGAPMHTTDFPLVPAKQPSVRKESSVSL